LYVTSNEATKNLLKSSAHNPDSIVIEIKMTSDDAEKNFSKEISKEQAKWIIAHITRTNIKLLKKMTGKNPEEVQKVLNEIAEKSVLKELSNAIPAISSYAKCQQTNLEFAPNLKNMKLCQAPKTTPPETKKN